MHEIDFGSYARSPRINATSGFVVSVRLIKAAPIDLTSLEKVALESVRNEAKLLQVAVGERHRTSRSHLPPLDRRFDGSWAALHGRLAACTRLVDDPEALRAEQLIANLFPHGLRFLNSSYEAEWFHSRMLLDRIEQEDLLDELIELASERFVVAVQKAHAALGDALRLAEEAEPDTSVPKIGEQVAALAEAIGDYGRVLAGGVNRKDAKSRARFLAAVAPIDALRARNRRNTTSGESDPDAETFEDAIEGEEGLAQAEDDEVVDFESPLPPVPEPADE